MSSSYSRRLRLPALTATAIILIILSARLDFLAGNVPQTDALVAIFRAFSFLGDGFLLIVLCGGLLAAGYFMKNARAMEAGKQGGFAVIVSGVAAQVLKTAFERPRVTHSAGYLLHALKDPSFVDLTGRYNSFPSGHTATAFAVAFVMGRVYPRLRVPLYAAACLVAASRVYLGSHFPSDVVAGAALGVGAEYLIMAGGGIFEKRRHWITAGLMLMVVFISFFKLGGFLLFDVDEAVFSEASREMVETGDVITPTYNYEPRYDKPILFYWFMALSFKLFGTSEFSARFTSAGFGAMLVLITFLFVRRHTDLQSAVLSITALLLNIMYFVYSHSAVTDMTLAFFISGAVYSLYTAVNGGGGKYFAAFWASAALAVLTKGAIGLLFPLAIALLYLGALKDKGSIKRLFHPLYLLIFLVIALPWFIVEYHANGWEFIDAFIIKHHIRRFAGVISSHGGPPYYYILVLLLGFFPWVAFLPSALYHGFRELSARTTGSTLFLFSSIWFLFIFIFFSISRTKLPNYIFPAIPAASVMCGVLISDLLKRGARARTGFYLMAGLSFSFSAAFYIIPFAGIEMEIPFTIRFFHSLGGIFLFTGILSLTALKKPRWSVTGIASLSALLIIFLRLHAVPPVNIFMQKDLYAYASYARELGSGVTLATYEINQPSINFYAARKVVKLDRSNIKEIASKLKDKRILLITKRGNSSGITGLADLRELDSRGAYTLLTNAPGLPALPE